MVCSNCNRTSRSKKKLKYDEKTKLYVLKQPQIGSVIGKCVQSLKYECEIYCRK